MQSDVLLKNGVTVYGDPIEIAIKDGKIEEVSSSLETFATEVIDLKGSFVSYGWIDGHVHCNESMDIYYDNPDDLGVHQGVCTIIDAGSTGSENIDSFYDNVKDSKTNVYALINISKTGIMTQDELSDLKNVDVQSLELALKKYPDFIVGIKARMSQSVVLDNGIAPLLMAKEIQKDKDKIPLMVHIGSAPPKLKEICDLLEHGDMITHCFNGKENGILDHKGNVHPYVWEALKRGVLFDIGHGSDSFSFEIAEKAFSQCFYCQTISTDSYHRNRMEGPVYDMSTTLEKMLKVGYSLPEIIPMITDVPAKFFNLHNKGKLEPGYDGDITVFDAVDRENKLIDSKGEHRISNAKIQAKMCIVNGKVFKVE